MLRFFILTGLLFIQSSVENHYTMKHKIVYIDLVAQHIRQKAGLDDTVNEWQPTFKTRMKGWRAAVRLRGARFNAR